MRAFRPVTALSLSAVLLAPLAAAAQDRPARFQRREEPTVVPVTVFHSPQSANLPTAETLAKGELQVEISHRFLPPISQGADALWGLDGPVFNRLGISYAATDELMLGLQRTNLDDNLDLNAKLRLLSVDSETAPLMVALAGGVAWNFGATVVGGVEDNESQAYAQVVLNALLADKLALGVVPSYVRNPRIADLAADDAFALGVNGQLYFAEQASIFGEWVATERRLGLERDPVTVGLELETGGHFFKLVITNTARMNPSQHLGGTPFGFEPDEWRFGFNITRLLVF